MRLLKIIFRKLMIIIIELLLIGIILFSVGECRERGFIRSHLPLPVKEETKTSLVEQREYLKGDPFKIQLWLNENVTGKSDGCVQYAQLPEETFERGLGDCEDYALLSKYFLEERYKEIHIVMWEGKFTSGSKNYEKRKGTVCHAVCIFKMNNQWGIMDSTGFLMTKGTLKDAIRFSCEVRYIKIKRAYTMKFFHYAYRRLKRII